MPCDSKENILPTILIIDLSQCQTFKIRNCDYNIFYLSFTYKNMNWLIRKIFCTLYEPFHDSQTSFWNTDSVLTNQALPCPFKWHIIISMLTLEWTSILLQMLFASCSCHTWEKLYIALYIWFMCDTGSILYALDILLLQLTQVTDHLKLRDRLSSSARQQRETTLLIYLKSTGRYERPIAYMFSFCWPFLCNMQLLWIPALSLSVIW